MSSRIERVMRRQQARAKRQNSTQLISMPSAAEIDQVMHAPVDHQFIGRVNQALSLELPPAATYAQAQVRLNALTAAFNAERFDQLLVESRRGALQAIVVPFGLGRMLSAYDKVGGNVDTIHNARNEVYATKKAEDAYKANEPYDDRKYHNKDTHYVERNRSETGKREKGELKDAYTGDTLGLKESQSLDHTISAKEIHTDPGRVLAELDGVELANSDSNLNSTTQTTNSAKGERSTADFLKYLERTREKRNTDLAALREKESSGEPLTKSEKNKLNKLTEQEKIDKNPELLLEKERMAREEYDSKINEAYYKSEKFRKDCIETSAKEGGKMAFQAAIGVVLVEFFSASFDEIGDWYRNGSSTRSVRRELRIRLGRITGRIVARWKDALAAAGTGFLAGFLSNLVTVLINAFLTTAKRAVRMIREGTLSLIEAGKTLLLRPQGMTLNQALDAALKVLVGGGVVVGAVMLEEIVSKYLMAIPFITPFADIATAVIVGATSTILSTLLVYLIDKLDPFSVNRDRLLEHIHVELDKSTAMEQARSATMLEHLDSLTTVYRPKFG
ncbi:hypothetical protein ACQKIK_10250 [Pseudomonas sp. NPDC047961]